jgi:predicted nucleic acid-binding protein
MPAVPKMQNNPSAIAGGVMAGDALIDSSAIVALLDRTDRWHGMCVTTFQQLRLPLVATEAVLTELFHLFGDSRHETELARKFIRCGAISLATIEDSELPEIQALMSGYWARPMDFADATLVYLARRERISTVFTVDHADFNTYRIEGRKRFRILPTRQP